MPALIITRVLLLVALVVVPCQGEEKDYCGTSWGQQNFSCEECTDAWKQTTQDIMSEDYKTYLEAVEPYLNASNIMYNYRYRQRADIDGWEVVKVHYPYLDDHYGMHAIAWRHRIDTWRVMVGIRGTWDVQPWGPEHHADICAGWYLLKYMARPDFCDAFTEQEMDYFAQLEDFITELREEQEGEFCLSFTGHSLGSILSNAMSVGWGGAMPAYSFSGPGLLWMAENTIPLPTDPEYARNVIIIYNQYDPIVEVGHFLTNQSGWLLRYDNHDVSAQCVACVDGGGALDYTELDGDCNVCSIEEHELDVMQGYMYRDNRVPETRTRYPKEKEEKEKDGQGNERDMIKAWR